MKHWRNVGLAAAGTAVLVVSAIFVVDARTPARPAQFEPMSVTFISADEGWTLGRLEPCDSPQQCPSVQHTSDGGRTWRAAQSMTVPPQARILRFANARDGWAWTPEAFWSTHDGGVTWRPVDNVTGRAPRSAIAASAISDIRFTGGTVQFVEGTADGELAVFTSPVESDAWTKSSSVRIDDYIDKPQIAAAHHSNRAWFWVSGEQPAPVPPGTTTFPKPIKVLSGAELVDGQLQRWTPPCSGTDEHPVRAQAPSETQIFVTCGSGPDYDRYRRLVSHDAGATFTELAGLESSRVSILSSATTADLAAEDSPDLLASHDGGQSWAQAYQPPREHGGDAFYLYQPSPGFITETNGFITREKGWIGDPVRPYRPREATLLATFDSGRTWAPVTFPDPQQNSESQH